MRFVVTAADVATQIRFLEDMGCSAALRQLRRAARNAPTPELARMALVALGRRELRARRA